MYNVESSSLILQLYSRAALLDCCFENESTSYTSGSDGFIQRFGLAFKIASCLYSDLDISFVRYDLNAGTVDRIGGHDDIATSVLYSLDKGQLFMLTLPKNLHTFQVHFSKIDI